MSQARKRVSSAVHLVLGCIVLTGCGREGAQASSAKAPATADPAPAVHQPAPAPTPAPAAPKPAAPPAAAARPVAKAESKAVKPAPPKSDTYSVLDVRIAAPKPLVLKVRVEPELAPDLASTTLKLETPEFTVAGRSIDVSGGRLSVCGIGLGPIEDRSVLTLQRGEVRVDDVFRGPLPAPPSAPVATH